MALTHVMVWRRPMPTRLLKPRASPQRVEEGVGTVVARGTATFSLWNFLQKCESQACRRCCRTARMRRLGGSGRRRPGIRMSSLWRPAPPLLRPPERVWSRNCDTPAAPALRRPKSWPSCAAACTSRGSRPSCALPPSQVSAIGDLCGTSWLVCASHAVHHDMRPDSTSIRGIVQCVTWTSTGVTR